MCECVFVVVVFFFSLFILYVTSAPKSIWPLPTSFSVAVLSCLLIQQNHRRNGIGRWFGLLVEAISHMSSVEFRIESPLELHVCVRFSVIFESFSTKAMLQIRWIVLEADIAPMRNVLMLASRKITYIPRKYFTYVYSVLGFIGVSIDY